MVPSQEDKWKLMVNQDPCFGSVAGDSIGSTEDFVGAVGGVDECVTAEHLSDVKWKDDDPLFVFDDKNVTKPQTPAAASTPVET